MSPEPVVEMADILYLYCTCSTVPTVYVLLVMCVPCTLSGIGQGLFGARVLFVQAGARLVSMRKDVCEHCLLVSCLYMNLVSDLVFQFVIIFLLSPCLQF